jgi:hypothetical protein
MKTMRFPNDVRYAAIIFIGKDKYEIHERL